MIEENDPDEVNPSPKTTGNKSQDNAKDVAKGRLLSNRGDANDDLGDQVHERNEKEKDLDKAGLFIEPTHFYYLPFWIQL